MSAIDKEPFPRGALIAAAALVGLSLTATAVARLERITRPQPVPEALRTTPVASVDLGFADRPDGSVSVLDRRSGASLGSLLPGHDGFVRGVVRGLAHDRMSRHIGPAPPFRLSELSGGRLFLEDTATGRLIDLQAFGSTNRAAFRRFLPAGTGAS